MVDLSSVEIPKPLNWQDFQRACVPLFRNVLRDPLTQEWGREGQNQHGIDLSGFRDGDTSKPVGVQCKRFEDPLTEAALRAAVTKAREFVPPLRELIVATTSDRDAKIQAVCQQITRELIAEGWPCRVVVMGWQDLRAEIARYPEALEAFLPGFSQALQSPIIEVVRDEGARTYEQLKALTEKVDSLHAAQTVTQGEYDADVEPDAHTESTGLHAKISSYRDLIRKGLTRAALEALMELLKQEETLPAYARYRVITNIAAVHFIAGRHAEALEYASRAQVIRPNDPKAQANLALAELVNGDAEAARDRAKATLLHHPSSPQAASALIQASGRLGNSGDPFELVPPQTRDNAEVMVAAVAVLRRRDDQAWRDLAMKAAAAHPSVNHLKRLAAEAELEPIIDNPGTQIGDRLPDGAYETVSSCVRVLKTIWDEAIQAQDVSVDELAPLAGNLATALRFQNLPHEAARVLDRTLERVGPEKALVRARAVIHLQADEDEKAVELLGQVEDDPETMLMTAHVLAWKSPDAALAILARIDNEKLPATLRKAIPEINAEIALARKDRKLLESALGELSHIHEAFAERTILRARGVATGLLAPNPLFAPGDVAADGDDDSDFEALAEKFPSHIQELIHEVHSHEASLSLTDRVQIAYYLDHNGAYEAAFSLLDGRIELTRDSVGLRTLLSASIGAHMAARAQAILETIPAQVQAEPRYQRLAAVHYWNTGDTKAAAPLIEAVFHRSPKQLGLFLWHIDCLLRLGQEDRVRQLIATCNEDDFEGNIEHRARLVSALSQFGQAERALRFGYRLLCLNRTNPAAWMGFMSLMFDGSSTESMNLTSAVITEEHMFVLESPDGSRRRYLIENDEELCKIDAEAYPPGHDLIKLAIGRQPKDTIALPDGTTATVVEAKHKYLEAFHTALARYNERFPNARGFDQIEVKTEGEEAFAELKAMLRARADYVRAQAQQYGEGRLSLGMLAFMTGVDPIDAMLGLSEVATPYRVAVGTQPEREAAIEAIEANSAKGCVVDAATYHCIQRLQIMEVVVAVCGPVSISQATRDIYSKRLAKLDVFHDGEAGTLGYHDGKMVFSERTSADRDAARAVILSDLAWLDQNAAILPARPHADPPPALRRIAIARDAHFFDDVFAASGAGRMLLVDDLFTRQMAGLLDVSGTSLQPVLMVARERRLISQVQYARALTNLIEIGQTSISIDAATLQAARQIDVEAGTIGVGPRFRAALKPLGGRNADLMSHSGVAIEYLRAIWSHSSSDIADLNATSHVLRALLKERTDYKTILNVVYTHMLGRRGFTTYLHEWARGHFLNWPDKDDMDTRRASGNRLRPKRAKRTR